LKTRLDKTKMLNAFRIMMDEIIKMLPEKTRMDGDPRSFIICYML